VDEPQKCGSSVGAKRRSNLLYCSTPSLRTEGLASVLVWSNLLVAHSCWCWAFWGDCFAHYVRSQWLCGVTDSQWRNRVVRS